MNSESAMTKTNAKLENVDDAENGNLLNRNEDILAKSLVIQLVEEIPTKKKFTFSFKDNPDLKTILLLMLFYMIQGKRE